MTPQATSEATSAATSIATAATCLTDWLNSRLSPAQSDWLQAKLQLVCDNREPRDLAITFGLIPRKLPRLDLQLDDTELQAADAARAGWSPQHWTIDEAARTLLLLVRYGADAAGLGECVKQLCRTADLSESIALYNGTAVFPMSDTLSQQIGEGLRSNMRVIFEAIAHRNPCPRDHFDQHRWNHMILKALFTESTLHPILGLDERANAELALILCDYAAERRAAGRRISYELWRCVGPFAEGAALEALATAVTSDDQAEHQAAVLALSLSGGPDQPIDPKAERIIAPYTETLAQVATGTLTWDALHS